MLLVFTFVYIANGIALSSAVYRLAARFGVRGTGWDDPFYIVAEVFNLILMGGNISAHIHSGQQELQSSTSVSSSILAYFMATWTMRAGVFVTLIRYSRVMTDRIAEHIFFSFLLIIIGVMFSVGGITVYTHSFTHEQGGFQHFPFVFTLLAISSDILADSCIIFVAYKFFIATTFRPIRKLFLIVGLCGPMSAMLITIPSWLLSVTKFSSSLRTNICMLNVSACYSIAMGSMPAVSAYLYRRYFPNYEETTMENTRPDIVFIRPETPDHNPNHDDQANSFSSAPIRVNLVHIPHDHDQLSLTEIDSPTESKPL